MRSIRSVGAALALAGIATIAGTAMPAFAATGPQIDVYPAVAAPGQAVSFSVGCISGKSVGTSATLFGTTLGLPARIPMGAATHKGVFQATVAVPWGTMPGTYSLSLDCSNRLAGTGALTVVRPWHPTPVNPAVVVPVGAPVTGDGATSTAVGGPLTAAGAALLGLSGIVGFFAIRRRRASAAKASAAEAAAAK
jgi:hypothetical protein